MSQSKTAYVYALCDPGTLNVRYVGVTGNMSFRMVGHKSRACTAPDRPMSAWISGLVASGSMPDMVLLEAVPWADRFARERYWIDHYRERGVLFNSKPTKRADLLPCRFIAVLEDKQRDILKRHAESDVWQATRL